ncbi:MAG: thioredoxin domain-containing protein [bacterium]
MENDLIKQNHWYQKWWGVVLLSAGSACFLVLIVWGVITARYMWQIKTGQANHLQKKFYGGFNQSIGKEIKSNKFINRKELETSDDPFLGNPSADIVIVEFVDFKCPNCKESADITKRLLSQYAYKVKLIIRDFPAESLHAGAGNLAEIAFCAHEQARFWQMYDAIFASQSSLPANLTSSHINRLADSAGVNYDKLQTCLGEGKAKIEINKDYSDGLKFGVKGTPTYFVNGQKVEGVVPFDSWEKMIKEFK